MYPRTAPEWQLVGGDPAPGDPCAYDALSAFFGDTAATAGDVSGWLRRLVNGADGSIWRGEAADAFRADLGEVPKKLDKLHDSYFEASEALRRYGVLLQDLQLRADTELGKAVAADEEHAAAVQALVDRMAGPAGVGVPGPATVGPGPSLPGAAPAGPNPAGTAEEPAARLAAARAAVERIRQERETAEAQAVATLEHASDLGIQNKGLLDRISGWAGDRLEDARSLHHKMLRVIGDLADRLADVLTVVAVALVAVAVVATFAAFVVSTAGGGGVLAASLIGMYGGAATASSTVFGWAAIAAAVSVGAKAQSKLLYDDPDLAWSQLAKDGALAGLGLAGGPIKATGFVRDHRYVQAAAWRMGELAASGNRVAQFSVKATHFAGQGADKFEDLHRLVHGTPGNPSVVGTMASSWKASTQLWDKHKDDPLAIFREPETSPRPSKEPDGVGVWVKDFGRELVGF